MRSTAASTAATLSAVLRDEPRPARIPDSLARIIKRCLAKAPAQRFQTVAELRAALERVSESAPATTPRVPAVSIAVLPFANMSSDADQEYFSDGLTEEIINLLARIDGPESDRADVGVCVQGTEHAGWARLPRRLASPAFSKAACAARATGFG